MRDILFKRIYPNLNNYCVYACSIVIINITLHANLFIENVYKFPSLTIGLYFDEGTKPQPPNDQEVVIKSSK